MNSVRRFSWDSFKAFSHLVFICHASYELERSQKIIFDAPEDVIIDRCVISASKSTLRLDSNYRKSLEGLSSAVARSAANTAPVVVLTERSELLQFIREVEVALRGVKNDGSTCVLLDISVFPRDRLFVTIDLVQRVLPLAVISLGYSEPREYSTDNQETGWLSKGVIEVISLPGFNGRQDPSKKSLLILNMGHENERMSITINNREPQRLVLIGQGDEQSSSMSGNYAARLFRKIQSDYGSILGKNDLIRANSRDMISVRDCILEVYGRYSKEYNIAVAFLGTKIQAIGALMACQKNRDIEAVYAQPQIYHREEYSKGVSDSYVIALGGS